MSADYYRVTHGRRLRAIAQLVTAQLADCPPEQMRVACDAAFDAYEQGASAHRSIQAGVSQVRVTTLRQPHMQTKWQRVPGTQRCRWHEPLLVGSIELAVRRHDAEPRVAELGTAAGPFSYALVADAEQLRRLSAQLLAIADTLYAQPPRAA